MHAAEVVPSHKNSNRQFQVCQFEGVSKLKLPPEFRAYLSKIGYKGGRKGGLARAANLTPEQRTEAARKAVQVRWEKAKAAKRQKAKEKRKRQTAPAP
jgi:hypothetical protein